MKTEADDLIERIGRGEQVAAVDLIDLFYERIYAFLRRLCFNDADAAGIDLNVTEAGEIDHVLGLQ